jgi:hypothetical protein
MWLQIVGKIRTAQAPLVNHCWQVTLYVSSGELTNLDDPRTARLSSTSSDFLGHQLLIRTSDGGTRSIAVQAMPVAQFFNRIRRTLSALRLETRISARPNEGGPGDPLRRGPRARLLRRRRRPRVLGGSCCKPPGVIGEFRSHFIGKVVKVSPVHLLMGIN